MKKSFVRIFLLLLITVVSFGYSSSNEVKYEDDFSLVSLIDINEIILDENRIFVSVEDIEKATEMFIFVNDILVDTNTSVSENDVLNISLEVNNLPANNIDICIGNEDVVEGLDNMLLGKNINDIIEFSSNSDSYRITINSIKKYPTELTDDIVTTFLNFESACEVKQYIKDTIVKNRIQEEAYYQLIYNSGISGEPNNLNKYVSDMLYKQENAAKESGLSMDEYLIENYELSIAEFEETMKQFYYEMLIVNAFAKKHDLYPSQSEIDIFIKEFADEQGISYDEANSVYGKEYFLYSFNYDNVCNYLFEFISARLNK